MTSLASVPRVTELDDLSFLRAGVDVTEVRCYGCLNVVHVLAPIAVIVTVVNGVVAVVVDGGVGGVDRCHVLSPWEIPTWEFR